MSRKARFRVTLQDFADREPNPDDEPGAPRTLCVVEGRPGGVFVTLEMLTLPSYTAALRAADRAQEIADEECLPRRAYVLDAAGIPVYTAGMSDAGRQQELERRQSIANCNKR